MCNAQRVNGILNGTLAEPRINPPAGIVTANPIADVTTYLNGFSGRFYDVQFAISNAASPNSFTQADLTAIRNLSVSTTAAFDAWLLGPGQAPTSQLLAQIPNGLNLSAVTQNQFLNLLGSNGGSPASQLWNLLVTQLRASGQPARQGIQVVASKLIAGKRPHLVPITDSFVRVEMGISGWAKTWTCFHALMTNPGIQAQLATLGAGLIANGPYAGGVNPASLTELRLLDLALWTFHRRRL